MGMSKEARVLLYTKMYTAVSKATAETTNAKGESVKATYNGTTADLFKDCLPSEKTVRAFMWAISHKTEALPTILFKIVKHGKQGIEIARVHSGFYDDKRAHIVGTALIPFIMGAMKLWEPKENDPKTPTQEQPQELETIKVFNLQEMSDDELTHLQFEIQNEFDRRASIREKQARLQQVLDLAEMSRDELMELLGTI